MVINKKPLYNILKYYTREYNLSHYEIYLDDSEDNCCVNHAHNYIQLSSTYIYKGFSKKEWKKRHPFAKTFGALTITILLHEIKHIIDYLHFNEMYMKNHYKYITEQRKNPLEIRADKFAEKEIKKWI